MKCISCGAEIGLTDKVCPHCGRVLTETAEHQADMEHYKARTEKTKAGVEKIQKTNIPLVISAVVMTFLIAGNCIAVYVKDNAYHFREDAQRKESVQKYDEYSCEIRDYLDAEDYTGFTAFMGYHNIAEWEAPYDDLRLLYEMAQDYAGIVSNVESAVMFGPDARRYRPEEDVYGCRRAIYEFYHEFDYKLSEIDQDPYKDEIYDMKEKADIILEVYLGLDVAGREKYFAASDIEQEAYLEEVLIHD